MELMISYIPRHYLEKSEVQVGSTWAVHSIVRENIVFTDIPGYKFCKLEREVESICVDECALSHARICRG